MNPLCKRKVADFSEITTGASRNEGLRGKSTFDQIEMAFPPRSHASGNSRGGGAPTVSRLLSEREAADMLGVKLCTIRNERIRGKLGFIKIGARLFYTQELINEYVERQRVDACAGNSLVKGKSEATGSARSQVAKVRAIRGARHGMTNGLDRHVVSALAQRTLTKRVGL